MNSLFNREPVEFPKQCVDMIGLAFLTYEYESSGMILLLLKTV